MSLLGSAGAYVWGVNPNLAHAATLGNGTRVLFLNLNGGLDGLFALQPRSGQVYSTLAQLRPTLSTDPDTLLPVGSSLGLHPNLSVFKNLFDGGELSTVLGVGYQNMSRSHLDSEVVMARGIPDRLGTGSSGFLNRLGAQYGWSSLNAISVSGNDPAFEGGDFRGAQVRGLENFYFRGFTSGQERNHLVGVGYNLAADTQGVAENPLLRDYASNFQGAVNNTGALRSAVTDHTPVQSYPSTQFGRALRDIDILFSTPELSTRIGYVRNEGFDTHSDQQEKLGSLLSQLNAAMSAFVTSMKSKGLWDDLIILVYSEFGRTNQENGSAGTDHGGANSFFLTGGAVNTSQVFGEVTVSDLTGGGWIPMRYNVVEVYRRIIERMGLDPNAIFAQPGGPSLAGLF